MERDLTNNADDYWTIENGQMVWGKAGFSTITCSIENGKLSCVGSNNNRTEWNLAGFRKK